MNSTVKYRLWWSHVLRDFLLWIKKYEAPFLEQVGREGDGVPLELPVKLSTPTYSCTPLEPIPAFFLPQAKREQKNQENAGKEPELDLLIFVFCKGSNSK